MKFVMDEPDREGFRELREVDDEGEGIVGWILIDEQMPNPKREKYANLLLNALNNHERLMAAERLGKETSRWYAAHHAKCEDIHGAECVPSEEEVNQYDATNHETWRVDGDE